MKRFLRNIKYKTKEIIESIKYKIKKYIEDILILGGLTLIVIATFLINTIIGLYVLGFILVGLGVFFLKYS